MTSKERKAMLNEINRQIAARDEQYAEDVDAMVLYALMVHKGWKKRRLCNFWNDFMLIHDELRDHYKMCDKGDHVWLVHQKLKEIGVDVHQWYKEVGR